MNKPCPKCQELGRDKTGNHLFLMKDGQTWTCPKPYHPRFFVKGDGSYTPPTVKLYSEVDLEVIRNLISGEIPERKLRKSTTKFYDIRIEYSEETREPVAHFYKQTTDSVETGWKKRTLPKTFSIAGNPGKDLFGQSLFEPGGKRILIAGGELDAASAFQMIHDRFSKMRVACVSPPNGENMKSIQENRGYIGSFEMIYVAVDMDEAGQKFAKQIVDFFGPTNVLLVHLPVKDVNQCLTEGKEEEFVSSFFNAQKYKPSGIVSISDISEEAMEPTPWGLSYPFKGLTEHTYGAMTGRVIGIGAGPGTGKTSVVQQIQRHLMFEHNQKVGVFSLEETPGWTVKKIVGNIMNKPIHLPDCVYDVKEAQRIKKSLDGHLYLFDHLEYHDQGDIEAAIRYFHSEGVKWFFIDPLSALHASMDPSEANTFLNNMMFDLEKMAKSMDITFFHVNHLNNPQGGKDHGAGGKVYGGQFAGSRAQWKYSTDLWGLERNQLADDLEERNKVILRIIKNRLSGDTGFITLKYDRATGNLQEVFNFE